MYSEYAGDGTEGGRMTPPDMTWETVIVEDRERFFSDWDLANTVSENYPRLIAGQVVRAPINQQLYVVGGLLIPAGRRVTGVSFWAAPVALAGGINQWFCVADRDAPHTVLGITVDDGANAWPANQVKRLALSTPIAPSNRDRYVYAACLVNAGTPPQLQGQGTRAPLAALSPATNCDADAGLTNPASCPAALTFGSSTTMNPWCRLDDA